MKQCITFNIEKCNNDYRVGNYNQCKDCCKLKSKCIHNKNKSCCVDCKGGSICCHNKQRRYCKICKGYSICIHSKIKYNCKECNKDSFVIGCENKVKGVYKYKDIWIIDKIIDGNRIKKHFKEYDDAVGYIENLIMDK
jgi:hypothetical protein